MLHDACTSTYTLMLTLWCLCGVLTLLYQLCSTCTVLPTLWYLHCGTYTVRPALWYLQYGTYTVVLNMAGPALWYLHLQSYLYSGTNTALHALWYLHYMGYLNCGTYTAWGTFTEVLTLWVLVILYLHCKVLALL